MMSNVISTTNNVAKCNSVLRTLTGRYFSNTLACDGMPVADRVGFEKNYSIFNLLFTDNNYRGNIIVKKIDGKYEKVHRKLGIEKEYFDTLNELAIIPAVDPKETIDKLFGFVSNAPMRRILSSPANTAALKMMNICMNNNSDFYVTPNQSKFNNARAASVFAYTNIVKDIDCHEPPEGMNRREFQLLCEELKWEIIRYLPVELQPNVINLTGRGLQLWWRHEACPARLAWVVNDVSKLINEKLLELLGEYDEYSMFNLDTCVDTSPLHLVRLPFSYNTKADVWGDAELVHTNIVNINTLKERFNSDLCKVYGHYPVKKPVEKIVKKEPVKETVCVSSCNKGYQNLLNHRCQAIQYCVANMHSHTGHRNQLLYAFVYSAVQCMSFDNAVLAANELNKMFSKPLKNSEVSSICDAVKNNGRYNQDLTKQSMKKYTQKTWEGFFTSVPGFSKLYEEFCSIKKASHYDKKKAKRHQKAEANLMKKMSRDDQIRKMAKEGFTQSEIMEKIGVCRKTIYNVLKGVMGYVQKIKDRVVSAIDSLSSKGKCCLSPT